MNVKNHSKYLAIMAIIFCLIFIFIFFFKLYPLKYKNCINEASNLYGINKAIIASVINTESGFNKNAQSSKGAVGLMQIMPQTAKWVAEKENIELQENDLFVPEINIKIGTYYLKYLINKFQVLDTAIIAYNAGEGNVLNWLKDKTYSKDGKTLSYVPFKESEKYLKKVKNSIGIYKLRM